MELKSRLAVSKITVTGHTFEYNTEATRWLGVYLDTGLLLLSQKNHSLEKARWAVDKVRRLGSVNGLAPGLIQKIQLAAVEAVALYGAELW